MLRDVANDIGMHESTVSRVVNNKYMHTPQGVFEMKYFFHSGISSSYGESVSSVTIKQRIRKIIENEDPRKPSERFEDRQHPAEGRPDAGAAHDRQVSRGAQNPDLEPEESAFLGSFPAASFQLPVRVGLALAGSWKPQLEAKYMRVEVTGRHVNITPPLRQLIARRLTKLERLLNDSAISAQIILSKEKYGLRAEIIVHVRGDHMLRGQGDGAELAGGGARCRRQDRAAGADAERQVGRPPAPRRGRENRHRAGRPEPSRAPRIVRATRYAVKPMSVDDVALRMESGAETFVVFRNADNDDAVSILYRRTDGNYGLIEPD